MTELRISEDIRDKIELAVSASIKEPFPQQYKVEFLKPHHVEIYFMGGFGHERINLVFNSTKSKLTISSPTPQIPLFNRMRDAESFQISQLFEISERLITSKLDCISDELCILFNLLPSTSTSPSSSRRNVPLHKYQKLSSIAVKEIGNILSKPSLSGAKRSKVVYVRNCAGSYDSVNIVSSGRFLKQYEINGQRRSKASVNHLLENCFL